MADENDDLPTTLEIAAEASAHALRLKELRKKLEFASTDAEKIEKLMSFAAELADTVMPLLSDVATAAAAELDELQAEVFGVKVSADDQELIAEALAEAIQLTAAYPQTQEKLNAALGAISGEEEDDDEEGGPEGEDIH